MRCLMLALAAAIAFAAPAFAQEKTRPADDPETAAPDKWSVGGGLEYWRGNSDVACSGGCTSQHVTFRQTGANLFVGYGDFTLQGTHRSGDGAFTNTVPGNTITDDFRKADNEIVLRWLIRAWSNRYVVPYALVGYSQTKVTDSFTTTGNVACLSGPPTGPNNSSTLHRDTTFGSPLFGVGGIFPFTERLGVRLDARMKSVTASVRCDAQTANIHGTGSDLSATGYWSITRSLNLQVGVRQSNLLNSDQLGVGFASSGNASNFFAMLGYADQF